MNIFFLDQDPMKCAQAHCDRHVTKMVLETAQILSTVIRNKWDILYGYSIPQSEKNNPCIKWASNSKENFIWLQTLGKELCKEFEYRYGHQHASEHIILDAEYWGLKLASFGITQRPQLMPSEYWDPDPITAYRNYYLGAKTHLLKYTKRTPPEWVQALELGEHQDNATIQLPM